MFKKNQLNWNFSINTAMYSCVTITAGANRTPMIERIAKIVNCLSRWLFSLGALSQMVDQFQLRHSIQHGVFCEAGWQFLALDCFLWELRLNCFISPSCATEFIHSKTVFHSSYRGTNIFFSFIITNCFNNSYTTFPWLLVSNILDFKFYCNRILFYFENDLR